MTIDLDQVFRALSHPDRRAFLRACRDAPRAAGDLAASSQLAVATVSEHLKVLRTSGLLVLDKEGRNWFYRTDKSALKAARQALKRLVED